MTKGNSYVQAQSRIHKEPVSGALTGKAHCTPEGDPGSMFIA